MRLLLLVVVACSGCAARLAAPPPGEPPGRQLERLERDLELQQRLLEQQLQVAARPDCPRLLQLGDNICRLAVKICTIADRHPDSEELSGRCRRARGACSSARRRLSVACPEQARAPGAGPQSQDNAALRGAV